MRATNSQLLGLLVVALFPIDSRTATAGGQYQYGEYLITIAPDPSATLTTADYQVTVENAELLLTRLTAPYRGTLSNSFVADLNRDGNFEVIVTYSDADGHDTGINVYTWKNYLLEPMALADLDPSQQQGYRGNDEFADIDGKLLRIFQIYEETNGEWTATPAHRQLRYSFEEARWTPN